MRPVELRTERLLLRDWCDDDLEPFAALNGDAWAMRFFPNPYDRERSDAMAKRIRTFLHERSWGLWALEVPGVAAFVGFVGLAIPVLDLPFMPCVEVGWRLARAHFSNGYATEAARAALQFGFETLELDEIVAMTAMRNLPSRAVMERLAMRRDPAGDFDHPAIAPGNPLRPHVLYRAGVAAVREDGATRH